MAETLFLPHVLREIADAFDEATALRFAAEFGGRHARLPREAKLDHPVAKIFGLPLLEFLIGQYGSCALLVPLGPHATYGARIRHIRRLINEGVKLDEIVKATGCHDRTVRRHRAKLRERQADERQGDLF